MPKLESASAVGVDYPWKVESSGHPEQERSIIPFILHDYDKGLCQQKEPIERVNARTGLRFLDSATSGTFGVDSDQAPIDETVVSSLRC
jgi:hypothetical protein